MKSMSLPNSQRGASVTSTVLLVIAIGLLAKFGLGVIPAYVGDYQFTKLVAQELKKANAAKQTEKQFLDSLSLQMSINANYTDNPKEMLVITNKNPGSLAVKSDYKVEYNYYGNTYIVNRFSKEITEADAK